MPSPTKRTQAIRNRKMTKRGAKRKAENRNKGTTVSATELFGDDKK